MLDKISKWLETSKKDVIQYLVFLAVLTGVLLTFNCYLKPISVSGHSMDDTLFDGAYGYSVLFKDNDTLERGEIVVVSVESDDGSKYIVKRVIGLPGETLTCSNGKVYVDGVELEEDYVLGNTENVNIALGDDEYFVLGDNREHSSDSRVYGTITTDQVLSKHLFIINSISHFGYYE